MPQTLGDMVFKDLEINEYFQELYSSILKNYSIHVFGIKTISPDAINLNDSLRFADLLSKSTDKKKSDEHKQLAQEVVALLNTLYPDNEEINYYYPTSDLVTGPDIIFFWVARMIMAGYEYRGKMPFKHVYFTGIVRDKLYVSLYAVPIEVI